MCVSNAFAGDVQGQTAAFELARVLGGGRVRRRRAVHALHADSDLTALARVRAQSALRLLAMVGAAWESCELVSLSFLCSQRLASSHPGFLVCILPAHRLHSALFLAASGAVAVLCG